jgi:FAD-linked oxidoreductase
MKRRSFLKKSIAIGGSASLGAISACTFEGDEPHAPLEYVSGNGVPWTNWAGNQACNPDWRYSPETEDELVSSLKAAKGVVRAVGAGHSFSAVVPTDDTLISTDLLSGLVRHDPQAMQATLRAGTRLHDMGPLLDSVGQALPNMPDMDYLALGGSIVNSAHATGNDFGSMGSYATALKLATPTGELLECSANQNADIFNAVRASAGSLGIITELTLQNQESFDLTEVNKIEPLEDMLDDIENRCNNHRHFELFAIPYASVGISVATDIAKPEDRDQGEDDPQAVNALRTIFDSLTWVPLLGEAMYDKVLTLALGKEANVVRTGQSFKVFPHVRIVRFREMEYTVPAAEGPACLREIMHTIKEQNLPLSFPIEYRYVKADDIWLSMFEGQDGCSISIHQYGDLDYKAPFAVLESVFLKYGGRPHWGKLHTLDSNQLASLYPKRWQDFQEIRRSLDPQGRLMNAHLKTIFGN